MHNFAREDFPCNELERCEECWNPSLQQFSYNKNAKTVLQDPSLWADAAYEGLIGGILGIFGRGTSTAVDVVENLINNKTMPGEKLMETAGVSESEVLGAVVLNDMANSDLGSIIADGTLKTDDIKKHPKAFCGRTAEEIADVLTQTGYDVSIKTSTRSRSGAKIIQISNGSGKRNISQVQVSPGGGRHGNNAYVKISTTDQGTIKVVDGEESTYKTDGKENATIIFSGGEP